MALVVFVVFVVLVHRVLPRQRQALFMAQAIELHHLVHQAIEVELLHLGLGQSRIVAKLIDQTLHGVDLVHDHFDRLHEHGLLGRSQFPAQLHLQAFGRELNGGEWVFDLVGQPPRHLTPGLGSLGRDHLRDVIKHQQPGLVGQDRAAGNEIGHRQCSRLARPHRSSQSTRGHGLALQGR